MAWKLTTPEMYQNEKSMRYVVFRDEDGCYLADINKFGSEREI